MRDKNPPTDVLIESYVRTMIVHILCRERQNIPQKTGRTSPRDFHRAMEKIDTDPSPELNLAPC